MPSSSLLPPSKVLLYAATSEQIPLPPVAAVEAAGHAVQLQLAAHAAFGKANGKGKGKSKKGKSKGKGKVVRSHWTLEQRREKLKSLGRRPRMSFQPLKVEARARLI